MANTNPNATVAGGTSAVGVAVVWFLGNIWPKVSISAELGAAIAGGASTILLYIGREGVAGLWRRIIHGNASPPAAP